MGQVFRANATLRINEIIDEGPLTIQTTGTTKDITLDATGDINLDPAGADITIGGVTGGAAKLTIGGTSLAVYGGDTTGDDLELYPNTADTATEYIKLLGAASVDILSTTKINLDGPVDISGDVTLDTAGTTGILLGAVDFTTGISITSTNLTDAIKISGTTPVDGLEISSACSANAINISGVNTANAINISGAQTIGNAIIITSTGTLTGHLKGLVIDYDSVTLGTQSNTGIEVKMHDTYGGTGVEYAAYFAGDTSTVSICADNVVGVTVTAGAGGTGEIVLADIDDANNTITGLNISKDLTYDAAVGAVGQTNAALMVTSVNATSGSADSILTVNNVLVDISETNSTAIASADVYGGFVTGITYTATTTGTGTATSSATALNIDYNLTLSAGTLSIDSFSIVNIDYDTDGAVEYNTGTFNMINVDMDDAAVPGHTASTIINGLQINTEGIDVTDADLTLNGIKITMPGTYGASTEYAGYFTGDGATVSVCNDDSVALSVSSAATTGNPVSIACNTITSGTLLNVTSTSAVSAAGELANFDHTSTGADIFSVQTDSPFVVVNISRTDSGTATATENYDVVSMSRTNNNSAAGTMTLQGSVLKLTSVATDSGTMTNSINVLEIINTNTTVDTDSSVGIGISGVATGITVDSCTALSLATGTITYLIDMDGTTGAGGTITSDSGSEAATWKCRIKCKSDDGTDVWINAYSVSNE